MALNTVGQNDNAGTLRSKVNAAINAINQGGGSGSGGSAEPASIDRVLNILVIGSSHADDAWGYVPYLLLAYGIKVRILMWRAGGAGFADYKTYYSDGGTRGGKIRYIDTTGESGSEWETWNEVLDTVSNGENCTVREAVVWGNTKWDLVSFHGNYSEMCNSFREYISPNWLIKTISADLPVTPLFGLQTVFTQAGVYDDNGFMYASLANHHNTFIWAPFDIVLPGGTAIFNARQFEEIKNACNSDTLLASDGIHALEGLPCYINSLACVEALFRKFYPNLTVMGDTTRVTSEWTSTKNIPDPQGPLVETSEENAYLAQRLAVLANDHPWDIMSSSGETYYTKDEKVKFSWNLTEGIWLLGALWNQATGIGNGQRPKHSYMGGKVAVQTGWTGTITSVEWTMGGKTYEVPIVNNEAYVLIKDICSDVVLTAVGENLTQTS